MTRKVTVIALLTATFLISFSGCSNGKALDADRMQDTTEPEVSRTPTLAGEEVISAKLPEEEVKPTEASVPTSAPTSVPANVSEDDETTKVRVITEDREMAATYYVDNINGSNANDGLSPDNAWKTIEMVNAQTFLPGDTILFRSGCVFTGVGLRPQGDGTAKQPITIGSYGGEERPVIHANYEPGTANDSMKTDNKYALLLYNVCHYVVKDLELTNYSIYNDRDNHNTQKSRRGVYIVSNGKIVEDITLDNLYIHDVNGSNWKHNTQEGAGIFFAAIKSTIGNDVKGYFNGLTIQNCVIKDVVRNGISQYYDFGEHPWGWNTWDCQWAEPTRSKNVVIRNNTLINIAGDGIKLWGTDGGLIEGNLVDGACSKSYMQSSDNSNLSAAIWPFDSNNTVIQYNEVCNTGVPDTTPADGQAFDIDYFTTNTIIQYNYSHDNPGGFLMVCGPDWAYSDGNVVRYNISENDGSRRGTGSIFHISGGACNNTYIYNNTIYTSENHEGITIMRGGTWDGTPKGTVFFNNIFYINGKLDRFGFAGADSTMGQNGICSYDNNLYYGKFFELLPADMPKDPNAILADPMFLDAKGAGGDIERIDAFKLREGSPAVKAGKAIDTSLFGQRLSEMKYQSNHKDEQRKGLTKEEYFYLTNAIWVDINGKRDYAGTKVTEKQPSVGAFEY